LWVDNPFDRVIRTFFTALALGICLLPLIGLLSNDSIRWGNLAEWVGAVALVFIAAGVWRIARNIERLPRRAGDRMSEDA
jgi:hypothetical protein